MDILIDSRVVKKRKLHLKQKNQNLMDFLIESNVGKKIKNQFQKLSKTPTPQVTPIPKLEVKPEVEEIPQSKIEPTPELPPTLPEIVEPLENEAPVTQPDILEPRIEITPEAKQPTTERLGEYFNLPSTYNSRTNS